MSKFISLLLVFGSASGLLAAPCRAATKIGGATRIEKDVRGDSDGRVRRLAVGDPVHANEALTTAAASRGGFVFDDRTNLQMGPSSRVTLDRFVYSGGSEGVVFGAAKGAFRFVSAPGGHKDYDVRTPTATIGVRGTSFAVRVRSGRTDAVLYGGVIEVCSIATGQCRTLDSACTFVTVTGGGVTAPKALGDKDWSFDSTCRVPGRRGNAPPPAVVPSGGGDENGGPPPPPPPSFGWGGPSFGISVGSAIGDAEFADPVPMRGAGFLGGLRLGYDWMITPDILVGFEADAQYRSDLGGGSNGQGGSVTGVRDGYLGTFRGRLGYAFDRWLVYGTGGLAYGHVIAPTTFSGAGLINPFFTYGVLQNSAFLPGWTVGGGVQFALVQGLSLRAEYLYTRLQHSTPTYMTTAAPIPAYVCNMSAMHGVRVGVDFGFSFADIFQGAP